MIKAIINLLKKKKDKLVYCNNCAYYHHTTGYRDWCGNEGMYKYRTRKTLEGDEAIENCAILNKFNDCEGFEKK